MAQCLGAPSGSIYHRFESRDVLASAAFVMSWSRDLNETSIDSRGAELDVLGATRGEFGDHQVVRVEAESSHPGGVVVHDLDEAVPPTGGKDRGRRADPIRVDTLSVVEHRTGTEKRSRGARIRCSS